MVELFFLTHLFTHLLFMYMYIKYHKMLCKVSSPWFQMHKISLAPNFYWFLLLHMSLLMLASMICPFAPFLLRPSLCHHISEGLCVLPHLRRASLSLVLKPLVSSLYILSLNILIDSGGMNNYKLMTLQYLAFTKLQNYLFNCPLQWQFSCLISSSKSICIKLNFIPSPYMGSSSLFD